MLKRQADSLDPLSTVLENLLQYQHEVSNFNHTPSSLESIFTALCMVLQRLNVDERSKFVKEYLQSILDNKRVPERGVVLAMMISMTSNDQFIFTDTSATAATILQHCDAAGNVTIYGLERSRTEDEAVKLQVLETTIQYFNQHVDWLKRGYDSAQEIGNPFSSMETAKALIGSMKTAVAKSRSSRKSKETYLFQNLPPTDQRSRRQVQVHKVPDLTSELAASLNTPTTSILPTVATPSSSTTLPSSSTTTREAKSFSFTIHKKVGTESLWKVTLQIPSSEPQANFYKLALVEMFGVNGEAVQDTKICSVNAVSNFAFSASNEKLLNRSLAKLQKQSEKIMDVNANDLRKQASKVVEDGFKAVFFGWLGNIRKGHDLVSSELKGLDSLFYKLVQEQSTLTKQITTLITSSNRQSLAKRIISNLKTLNTNKQSVTKMLFKTMNVDGKCSIARSLFPGSYFHRLPRHPHTFS